MKQTLLIKAMVNHSQPHRKFMFIRWYASNVEGWETKNSRADKNQVIELDAFGVRSKFPVLHSRLITAKPFSSSAAFVS